MHSGRQLKVDISVCLDHLNDKGTDVVQQNVALAVSNITNKLTHFVQSLSKFQRKAASHIWVVMISPEARRTKPYALPVQCFPYKNLNASRAREMIEQVIKEMNDRNMAVAGKLLEHFEHLGVFSN